MRLVEVHTLSLAAAAAELMRVSSRLPESSSALQAAETGDPALDEEVARLVDVARRSARGLGSDLFTTARALADAAAVYDHVERSATS